METQSQKPLCRIENEEQLFPNAETSVSFANEYEKEIYMTNVYFAKHNIKEMASVSLDVMKQRANLEKESINLDRVNMKELKKLEKLRIINEQKQAIKEQKQANLEILKTEMEYTDLRRQQEEKSKKERLNRLQFQIDEEKRLQERMDLKQKRAVAAEELKKLRKERTETNAGEKRKRGRPPKNRDIPTAEVASEQQDVTSKGTSWADVMRNLHLPAPSQKV